MTKSKTYSESLSLFEESRIFSKLSPRQIARGVSLTTKQIARALEIQSVLYRCGDDIDFWCEELGYDLIRHRLPDGVYGVLYENFITLQEGLSHEEEIVTIAHELFHQEYHGHAVAYRDKNSMLKSIQEGQAELFAALTYHPSLLGFMTEQEFMMLSPLPQHMKELRVNLFYLKKV